MFQSVVDTVHMRDIMLTDFSLLSPSDTLEDALAKAIHSLRMISRWCAGTCGWRGEPAGDCGCAVPEGRLRAGHYAAEFSRGKPEDSLRATSAG